ncbi:MAG: methyltransferase domain-containing protein [Candidatus Krumholzibacteriota bacterium]
MSFTPLPRIFTDICRSLDSPTSQIMEFGCGDGRFRDVLSGLGIACWGLDRIGPGGGTVAEVVGEAGSPPVASGSLDLLVVPNLLRHMLPAPADFSFLDRWLELLKPGGSLFIFEDEPGTDSPGKVNYRDLQVFLARLLPESRGALISLEEFQGRSSAFRTRDGWEFGLVRNRQAIATGPVLEMLGPGRQSGGEPARLARNIGQYGLDPGHYWWARATAEAKGTGH